MSSRGSTTPTLVLKCFFFFFKQQLFINNKVLDLSSYFYFQIMSTPAEEDNDDVDDEGTFPEHSVNKVLVNGGGLSRRGRPRWRRWCSSLPATSYADEDGLDGEDDAAPSRPPSLLIWNNQNNQKNNPIIK